MAEKEFMIEVKSTYEELWRYNMIAMCGCFDTDDRRIGFASSENTVAPVGTNLPTPPDDYQQNRILRLTTPAADHIVLYIYIIPHTLPVGREVTDTKPFSIEARITAANEQIVQATYPINQWSGASIELKIDTEGVHRK